MKNSKSTFKELTAINVKEKLEKKGRFDYLSWAYAWAIIKDKYPNANRKVYESETTELNYFTDGKTGYVKVGVCLEGYDNSKEKNALGVEHVDYLPIKGNNNQSIPLGNITSFAVNTSIQRSTVKAIGMHGLGLSLWVGEDLKDIGEDVISVADEGLNLGIPKKEVKKSEPKKNKTTQAMSLDIGDDNWYNVLHKIIKYRDDGNDFKTIMTNLKKQYTYNIKTEKHIKEIYDGEKIK